MKNCLLIGGYDPSQGAGLSADLRAAKASGVRGIPILTCVASQTHERFIHLNPLSFNEIHSQLKGVGHQNIHAIKIGALGSLNIWPEFLPLLKNFNCPIVLDPVLKTTSGGWLCTPTEEAARRFLFQFIFPHIDLLTPNIPEAEFLLDEKMPAKDMALSLHHTTKKRILLKGGHAMDSAAVTDWLADEDGCFPIKRARVGQANIRGTGCFLATSIAAHRAREFSWKDAVLKGGELLFTQRLASELK